jgi:hypothetical protein
MNALQQVSRPLVLQPAYGRRYATIKDMVADWEAGKDFSLGGRWRGPYCSIRDLEHIRSTYRSMYLADSFDDGVSVKIF